MKKKPMKQVYWGMIGCGDVTELKSGPAFNRIAHSNLVAVMCRHADKAADYAKRHSVPRWYYRADDLLSDPQVNAVYVATPPSSHAEYTIRALQAGKPVYVEKPMALTYAQCQEMIAAARQAQVPLFVAYYRRRLPRFLKIKELVDTGAVGTVRTVHIEMYRPVQARDRQPDDLQWRVLPEIAGGGHFVDLAPHQFDFLDFLLGPIVSVQGMASNQAGLYPAEDVVGAQFLFHNGVLGSGLWCFTASEKCQMDEVRIAGSGGYITFSTFDHQVPVTLEHAAGSETFDFPKTDPIQQPLIETVVDALLGRGTCPSTGESGARTTWVIDQILDDYRQHVNWSAT
jgi:predicted dehydrogenase